METHALNAFATGLNEKQYSITVTSGLLDRLDDAELEAVLGHELTHIRNGDVRMLVIAVIIAGVISFFAELVFRLLFQGGFRFGAARSSSGDRKGSGGAVIAIIIAVVLIAVAWLLSIVIRFALSRQREYLADAGSVELTKNPDAMITALRKIEGRGELEGATSAVMEMCVDNPRSGFADLFATHPSIDSRIAAIVKFAGGHDPGPDGAAGAGTASRRTPARTRAAAEPAPTGPGAAPASRSRAATSRSCRRGRRSSSAAPHRAASEPGPVGAASQELSRHRLPRRVRQPLRRRERRPCELMCRTPLAPRRLCESRPRSRHDSA